MTWATGLSRLSTAFLTPSTSTNSYLFVSVWFFVTMSHYVIEAGLELAKQSRLTSNSNFPASDSQVLGLQACAQHNIFRSTPLKEVTWP